MNKEMAKTLKGGVLMKKSIVVLLTVLMLFTLISGVLRENIIEADAKLGLGYIIVVANSSLKDTVQDFVKFKESQGFDVIVEDVPTIETNYQGIDRAEKIRNFLKDKTKDYPKAFTLLIGTIFNPSGNNTISTGGEIPMRYVDVPALIPTEWVPNHFPTDFYYADLKGNWDANHDGVYGTKNDYIYYYGLTNFVGRIPFSDPTAVRRVLNSTIANEKTINSKVSPVDYKFLFAMTKQSSNGKDAFDGAKGSEWSIKNILNPAGFFKSTTLYEKEGDAPSQYNCTAPLNEANFTKYLPDSDILVTFGHGGVLREIWFDSNKNGIVDENEVKSDCIFCEKDLEDANYHLYLWIDEGCRTIGSVGYEASDSNILARTKSDLIGVECDIALYKGLVPVAVGSTTDTYFAENSVSILNTLIIDHKPIGEWLDFSVKENHPSDQNDIHGLEYYKGYYLTFNILGDPSFGLFNDSLTISADVVAPTIKINFPTNDYNTNDFTLNISGTVYDIGSGIKSVEVNSKQITVTNNNFNTIVHLQKGRNVITVKATDKAGNVGSQIVSVYYKPHIVISLQIGKNNFIVNSEMRYLDSPPIIKNSRTILPIRPIVEALGGSVTWDEIEHKVTISLDSNTLELWIGKPYACLNGIYKFIDGANPNVVPEIINGRTMLPLRFIAENIGCTVQWDQATKVITIIYGGS